GAAAEPLPAPVEQQVELRAAALGEQDVLDAAHAARRRLRAAPDRHDLVAAVGRDGPPDPPLGRERKRTAAARSQHGGGRERAQRPEREQYPDHQKRIPSDRRWMAPSTPPSV